MKVAFELTGEMPLIMHRDNIEGGERVKAWQKDPANKNVSVPGDDRSPPWTWHTYCYEDGEKIVMPQENIMAAMSKAGAQLILKKQKTFKEITQSGLIMASENCDFLCNDKEIAWADIDGLRDEVFAKQSEAAQDLGFSLFVKRAKIGTSKHVRVRPRFDDWKIRGTLNVMVQEITFDVLSKLFELAGRVGLGDWRPGCKTPGPFGMFTAKLRKV